jgi:hypothetical protein
LEYGKALSADISSSAPDTSHAVTTARRSGLSDSAFADLDHGRQVALSGLRRCPSFHSCPKCLIQRAPVSFCRDSGELRIAIAVAKEPAVSIHGEAIHHHA